MKSLREVGLGLSVVFGCLLLALVAELYYLLWWKKKRVIVNRDPEAANNNNNNNTISFCFCKKLPFLFRSECSNPLEICSTDTQVHEPQQAHTFWNKPFGIGDETAESELFRLQSFPGPPRFLFTIKEETKEDLESEDAKSKSSRKNSRSKSLSEFFHVCETPYLTPISSPKYFTPPLTPVKSRNQESGFGSFDSASEAEFNCLVRSSSSCSPPPKFQFLKDAEEKLLRNCVRNQGKLEDTASSSSLSQHQHHVINVSNSSQILPLESQGVGS